MSDRPKRSRIKTEREKITSNLRKKRTQLIRELKAIERDYKIYYPKYKTVFRKGVR